MRASYPLDECGSPKVGGIAEIEKLDEVSRIEHVVQLTPDAVPEWMGCTMIRVVPEIGRETLIANQYWVRDAVCRYITGPDGNTAFAGAELLEESLDQLFTDLPSADECAAVASVTAGTSLSLAGAGTIPVLIEIDGCQRVLIDGHIPLQASSDIIAQVA
ncbi:hypothetical protein ACFRFQ_17985 [Rhodococcus sp. NPDC056743]|uniref:hypothetical protein n=1 Tax=Rhodococcus sp. NPDC056743 TaxID=3345934 RepID=UPI00366F2A54